MCLHHGEWVAFFAVPEGDCAFFIARNDLATMVSPEDDALLGATLGVADALCKLLLARLTDVEDRYVPVDVGRQEEVLRLPVGRRRNT